MTCVTNNCASSQHPRDVVAARNSHTPDHAPSAVDARAACEPSRHTACMLHVWGQGVCSIGLLALCPIRPPLATMQIEQVLNMADYRTFSTMMRIRAAHAKQVRECVVRFAR